VADILRRCVRVKVLVTSRQPLRISGERGVRVPPMALPEPGKLPSLAEVAQFEAVRLFVDRAQSAQFDFELTDQNVAAVVEICRRVDALPLAIELATARLYEMDVQTLLAALEKRMAVLTEGAVDLLDHQRTLKDLVAWSYDLLQPDEQRLWRRLAVFAGGCTIDAAEAVCDTDDEYDLEKDAPALAMKSLVNVEFVGGTSADNVIAGIKSEERINMLETLREFAVEKLAESGEAPLLESRHAQWFTTFAEAAEAELRGPKVDAWARRLDAELANFRATLARSMKAGAHVDLALRTGAALWFYWYQRGFLSEGRGWLEAALDADAPAANAAIRANALLALANLERHLQRAGEARAHAAQALDIYRAMGDKRGTANALGQLGMVTQYLNDFGAAATFLEEAIPLLRELENWERLTVTLVALGGLRQMQGDLEAARTHLADSLRIARDLDDPHHIATALVNLGEVMQLEGDTGEAARLLREGLDRYHALGLKNCIAYCIEMLAAIDAAEGRPGEAAQLFGAADRLREVIGVPVESFNRARYDHDLSAVRTALGDLEFRRQWDYGRALDTGQAVGLAMHDFS
jgi:predicted ATPase